MLDFWVEGDAARGLELSQGYPGSELIELNGGVARVDSVVLTCIPMMYEDKLVGLELDLRLLGRVTIPGVLGRAGLENRLQEQAEKWLKSALELAQEKETDFMGLARMAGASRPEVWHEMDGQWQRVFPELEVQLRCTAKLSDEKE